MSTPDGEDADRCDAPAGSTQQNTQTQIILPSRACLACRKPTIRAGGICRDCMATHFVLLGLALADAVRKEVGVMTYQCAPGESD